MEHGTKLGHYTILSAIGRGGMGRVWKAQDTKLGREVAIKTLSEEFADDTERLARFEREAKLLASLNHPNVASIYGLEEWEGMRFLVLELVEGQTLAERIQQGVIAIEECLRLAFQIAEALEAAHEKSVIHRDLKPANIKVTPDGKVKVLDFGLAKALAPDRGDETLSNSPTLSLGATQQGIILGTPRYMSPEQARGQTIDKRTDIWSFGTVLYEMLTGHPPFPGQSHSDTIAAILNLDPDWRALPASTPGQVRTLLERCLEKDPRQRLRDIGDARIELDKVIVSRTPDSRGKERADEASSTGKSWTWRRGLVLAGLLIAVIALTFMAATWLQWGGEASAEVVHMTELLPQGVTVTRGPGMILSVALSPDGRTLVIAGSDANGQRLYQRTIDQGEAKPLAGTEGALSPFFSPDGGWIGFFADRRLKRVPAGGGAAVDIAPAPGYPAGASWGVDNRIVFSYGYLSPLRVVEASGGTPKPLTTIDAGVGHQFPEMLPDGRMLLFNEGPRIHALDLMTGRRKALIEGVGPRYVSSGHLIFRRGTTLLAAPFDSTRAELTGDVVPVVDGVASEQATGGDHVALSRTGSLAYVPAPRAYALVLVEPDGTERLLSEDPRLENPQFSPDGRRLVVVRIGRAGARSELWMYDLESAAPPFRLTSDGGRAPVWSPDGASVTYSQLALRERSGIYTVSADGRGNARQVIPVSSFHWLVGWTQGQTLVYGMVEQTAADGVSRSSILAVKDGKSRRVVGPADTWGGRLSPDGRRLVYYSADSGNFEIYVTSFPDTSVRNLIAEGTDPSWSPDGSEIYYRSGSRLMAARIDPASGVRVLSRRSVFEPFLPPMYDDYDVHDRTLALVRPVGYAQGREIKWVLNWLPELQRLMRGSLKSTEPQER